MRAQEPVAAPSRRSAAAAAGGGGGKTTAAGVPKPALPQSARKYQKEQRMQVTGAFSRARRRGNKVLAGGLKPKRVGADALNPFLDFAEELDLSENMYGSVGGGVSLSAVGGPSNLLILLHGFDVHTQAEVRASLHLYDAATANITCTVQAVPTRAKAACHWVPAVPLRVLCWRCCCCNGTHCSCPCLSPRGWRTVATERHGNAANRAGRRRDTARAGH